MYLECSSNIFIIVVFIFVIILFLLASAVSSRCFLILYLESFDVTITKTLGHCLLVVSVVSEGLSHLMEASILHSLTPGD